MREMGREDSFKDWVSNAIFKSHTSKLNVKPYMVNTPILVTFHFQSVLVSQ